jgi:hypothetical protein
MKILITGMNKQQCTENFYKTSQLKVMPSHVSLIACLRDMGHEVEQRIVTIGEDLSSYDKVICYIHNPSGFAGFVYNGLYTISSVESERLILAFDDWQTDSIYKGLMALQDETKLFRDFVKNSHNHVPDDVEKYKETFLEALQIIESKSNRMLISAFAGGKLDLLIDYPEELMYGFNPNPYHINLQSNFNPLFDEKQRVFNYAGLIQDKTKKWIKDQNIGDWELKKYGSRKDGQDRVIEPEMVNIYGQQWGILMPGYFHAGSGWWRARPLQVADAGSILIGDWKEMVLYYDDDELASIKAHELIMMSDNQLKLVAAAQKKALYTAHPLDKDIQQEELKKVLT